MPDVLSGIFCLGAGGRCPCRGTRVIGEGSRGSAQARNPWLPAAAPPARTITTHACTRHDQPRRGTINHDAARFTRRGTIHYDVERFTTHAERSPRTRNDHHAMRNDHHARGTITTQCGTITMQCGTITMQCGTNAPLAMTSAPEALLPVARGCAPARYPWDIGWERWCPGRGTCDVYQRYLSSYSTP
jgi:hypothetical protein